MKTSALLKTFIAIALIYLTVLLFSEDWAWFAKPLLLPSLIGAVAASQKFATKSLLFWALLLSWFGDMILMFTHKGELFFIIGLAMFLMAHVLYIVLFSKQPKTQSGGKVWFYLGTICIVGYLFAMLYFLFPTLGGLKIPVTVYAFVISAMLLMAVKGFSKWKSPANYYLLMGAICFVASDSLLAFDKFYKPLPLASLNIMSTYLTAQFLITFGILVLNKKQHSVLTDNAAI